MCVRVVLNCLLCVEASFQPLGVIAVELVDLKLGFPFLVESSAAVETKLQTDLDTIVASLAGLCFKKC